VAERRVVPAGDLDPQVGGDLRIGDALDELRVLADELVPLVGRRREALELLGDVVVRVVLLERRAQRDERAVEIVELLLVDAGRLHEAARCGPWTSPGVLRAREEEVDQLDPALALLVEALELDRGRDCCPGRACSTRS
jgi:hypothetical protein